MNQIPFTIAVVYWLVIIIIAHFFAPPGYIWTQNTISELASQGHVHKWIMQVGLMGFGALIVWAVGLASFKAKKVIYPIIPVAIYGLAVFLSGIYCAAPIDPAIQFSSVEAQWHSNFATVAGWSLSVGIIWQIFLAANRHEKWIHIFFLVAVMGFAVLFGLTENSNLALGTGIAQRLLYLSGFGWLVYQEHMRLQKELIK